VLYLLALIRPGVLDFLIEALEEWQRAKDEFRKQLSAGAEESVQPVPYTRYASTSLLEPLPVGCVRPSPRLWSGKNLNIFRQGMSKVTSNVFYESWVNKICIEELLKTRDVENAAAEEPLYSLLDSSILDDIADCTQSQDSVGGCCIQLGVI
jgi:hypothetical protein